ncbi:MAG: hypothetical protein LBG63_01830 [Candidatus Methanoplasma sp.]|jgi:hypothetical protein|nr:hypothetical protein [Candidatus Methanoplasma sp.]
MAETIDDGKAAGVFHCDAGVSPTNIIAVDVCPALCGHGQLLVDET